jgi:hypothetical protein
MEMSAREKPEEPQMIATQVMKIADILAMPSVEGLAGGYGAGVLAAECLDTPRRRIRDDEHAEWRYGDTRIIGYAELRDIMSAAGTCEPVEIIAGHDAFRRYNTDPIEELDGTLFLGNGHHRLALAIELGWTEIPVRVF